MAGLLLDCLITKILIDINLNLNLKINITRYGIPFNRTARIEGWVNEIPIQEVAGQVAMFAFIRFNYSPAPIPGDTNIAELIRLFDKYNEYFQFRINNRYYFTGGPIEGSEPLLD